MAFQAGDRPVVMLDLINADVGMQVLVPAQTVSS
jgi:hypothetical protein